MALRAGERDVAIMQHEIEAEFAGGRVERISASLTQFGDAEASAMARTVGLTAGAAAALLLDGGAAAGGGGVYTPTTPRFYAPILETLRREGVEMRESVRVLAP